MAWTFAAVKVALAALDPPITDPGLAAAALNAQTVSTKADIATADARAILLVSGEWYAIKRLASQTPSGSAPPSAADQAIMAASICVDTLTLTTTLHVADDATWTAVQTFAGALVSAGVLSQASLNAWAAMRNLTIAAWMPPIDAGIVQTAEAQP